jgi:hypothetical protein
MLISYPIRSPTNLTLKQESDIVIRNSIAAPKMEAINNWNEPKETVTNFARLVGTLIGNDPLNVSIVVFFNMVIKKLLVIIASPIPFIVCYF